MGLYLENGLTEGLILLGTLLGLLYYYITSNFQFWAKLGIPFAKPSFPFGNFGSSLLGYKTSGEVLADLCLSDEWSNQKYAGAFLSRNPIFVPIDPDFIKEILIKDFPYFSDRGLRFNEKKSPLSAHLFNLGGWRWRVLRTKLSPSFTSGKMKLMYGIMAECAAGLDQMLHGPATRGQVIEIKEPLAQFTTDTIGTCAFGLQFNSIRDQDSDFRKAGRAIFAPSKKAAIKRALLFTLPFADKLGFSLSDIPSEITEFFMNVVNETLKEREENKTSRNDMMQLLIDVKKQGPIVDQEEKYKVPARDIPTDDSGRQIFEMDNKLLAAQAFVFFLAGFETSSTTMSFALYELARNPDVQDRLAAEIEEYLNKTDGKLTYDVIQDMKYLDMVISEALRKYPPVQNLFRRVTRPYKLPDSDTVLPEGVRVFIPIWGIQHNPQYYPDPDKFDPERFTPEEKAKRHPMLYLPFGDGPRNCIGARFGLLQSKLGIVTIIRKYRLEVCEGTPIPPKLDPRAFVTTLQGGVNLRIRLR